MNLANQTVYAPGEVPLAIAVGLLLLVLFYAWVVYPILVVLFSKLLPPLHSFSTEASGDKTADSPEEQRHVSPLPQGEGQGEGDQGDSSIISPSRERSERGGQQPFSLTVVLAAHNEETHIGHRLQNLVDVLQPKTGVERWSVLVGVDGSTDWTAEISKEFAKQHPQVTVQEFNERRGKVAVLKDLVGSSSDALGSSEPRTEDEDRKILIFTDANTTFKADAIEKMLRHFTDSTVGGVCGRLVLYPSSQSSSPVPEARYWGIETALKTAESRIDSCLGANGAIYAIRRELFWQEIPENTVVDDFVIGMKVREQGFRMVYEPAAIATEALPESRDEWSRRVRIGAGDYQALGLCRRCLGPTCGAFAWMFFSHKLLRWLTPPSMLFLVLGSWFLVVYAEASTVFVMSLVVCSGSVVGIVAAMIGRMLRRSRTLLARPFQLVDHFVSMQAALLAGAFRYCRGGVKGYWTRTPR